MVLIIILHLTFEKLTRTYLRKMDFLKIFLTIITISSTVKDSNTTALNKFALITIKEPFKGQDYRNDFEVFPKPTNAKEDNLTITESIENNDGENENDKLIPISTRPLYESEETNNSHLELKPLINRNNSKEDKLTLVVKLTSSAKIVYDKLVPLPIRRLFEDEETKRNYQIQPQPEMEQSLTIIERVRKGGQGIYDKVVPLPIRRLLGTEETKSSQVQSCPEITMEESLTIIQRVRKGGQGIYDTIDQSPIRRLFTIGEHQGDPQTRSKIDKDENLSLVDRVKNGGKDIYDKIVPSQIKRLFESEEAKGTSQKDTFLGKVKNSGKNIYEKYVPSPIKHLIGKATHDDSNFSGKNDVAKEHGNLDSFGRDVVKTVSKTISQFGNTRTRSEGLDSDKGFFSGLMDGFKEKVKAIFPGTLWCGDGNIANNGKELGFFYLTDDCCRGHDNCRESMAAGEVRSGLENTGLFTRSNCECDQQFHNCLKKANSIVSNKIGFTYFSVLGPQCFKVDYPVIKCAKTYKKRCVEYEYDTTKEKYEQWFDNPTY